MLRVGSNIDDYEVVAPLRSGGMAELYLARRTGAAGFSRPVAIKVIRPHLGEDKNFVKMFVDEAKISAKISHPNVVHVEELGETDSYYYLVMEYVHGCSLSQLVRALRARGRRFSVEMAAYLAMQVADGLHAAHETVGDDGDLLNIVHRDVSPQNVLLSYKGHTKLIDFGVAKARGREAQTTVASLKGKLRYMSPEQAVSGDVDRRTDVYALGIVFWEMLTMRTLFKADNDLVLHDMVKDPKVEPPSAFNKDVPAEVDQVIMKALAPNIEDRPASARDFRRLLADAVPKALTIDAEQLSDLLKAVMVDTIREQHRRLPESVSVVLRREIGSIANDLDTKSPDEVIDSLTTSSSKILDSQGNIMMSGSGSIAQTRSSKLTRVGAFAAIVMLALAVVFALFLRPGSDSGGEPGRPSLVATPPPEPAAEPVPATEPEAPAADTSFDQEDEPANAPKPVVEPEPIDEQSSRKRRSRSRRSPKKSDPEPAAAVPASRSTPPGAKPGSLGIFELDSGGNETPKPKPKKKDEGGVPKRGGGLDLVGVD